MYLLKKSPRGLGVNEPILDNGHGKPVTRREMIARGFMTGPAVIAAPSILAMMFGAEKARAMSADLEAMKLPCGIIGGAGKIPFIAFDLSGGWNSVGSEILGGQVGQLDFLTTAGYAKQGLPGEMTPNSPNAASATNNFINQEFGTAWHSDGAILRGMQASTQVTTRANVNGFPIAARSENDTSNNPHNPMYGINRVGADGELLTLIGSQNSDSGGNSIAPPAMMNPAVRPTKVDRASDVTGLVDTGELSTLFTNSDDAIAVLESMTRLSHRKTDLVQTKLSMQAEADLQKLVKCGYVKSTYLADTFRSPDALNPDLDPHIVMQTNPAKPQPAGITPIFTAAEYAGDNEFRKTAAIMKMVLNGFAGAGTINMGGYDYHGQGRDTAEIRNFRAGRCIGACLEYAARKQIPLMIYAFSDGSLSANGVRNMTVNGRGKLDWASDNQSTAAPFVLVYNPTRRPVLRDLTRTQLGKWSGSGDVQTTAFVGANAVNLLVETVILNYMALHGEEGQFTTKFPSNGLGGTAQRDATTMFAPLVNGTVTNPV